MSEIQEPLKVFTFHGIELKPHSQEAIGRCPFCDRERKFSVNQKTGQWRCFVCQEKGNIYSFLQRLWEESLEGNYIDKGGKGSGLNDRGLLREETFVQAGVRASLVTGEWIVPGYNVEGKLTGLYRYARAGLKFRLQPTPEVGHRLFRMEPFEDTKDRHTIYLCEKPWDAMVWWEMLGRLKRQEDGTFIPTANRNLSLLADSFVLSTHGCNVFQPEWAPVFAGKDVVILFDNDHPGKHPRTGNVIPPAALEGTKRVAQILAQHEQPPRSIHYLQWGPQGYDLKQKKGMDVRDILLMGGPELKGRIPQIRFILDKVKPIPASFIPGRSESAARSGGTELELKPCHSWKTLTKGWRKALQWTPGLDSTLAVMLASITSTETKGDQLWVKVIGPPASGKSTLCEAISTSKRYVYPKSTIRGFHSGYKTDKEGTEDNSLIAKIQNKTLVTKDGDTLLSSQDLPRILSEARDLYDSTSRAHYRHGLDRNYENVRMTWILCGTRSLHLLDDSELGQRFVTIEIMSGIDSDLEDLITLRKAHTANREVKMRSGKNSDDLSNPELTEAMQLTGGYVEYLRANADELLNKVEFPDDLLLRTSRLGIFVAYMRARPSSRQKEKAEREFGTRLVSQFVRLANCVAVVLNKEVIDDKVMEIVQKVALDTASGRVIDLCRLLNKAGEKGMETKSLAISTGHTEQNERDLLLFLKKIGAVELFQSQVTSGLAGRPRWRLTRRVTQLYQQVVLGGG